MPPPPPPPPPTSLDEALVNEQLAHELILDPGFQLPPVPEPPDFSPPAPGGPLLPGNGPAALDRASGGEAQLTRQEMVGRVQSTMQELFWQRLVSALTPSAVRGREDVVVGATVQARFGGAQGNYYEAKVTACHADGTFDIEYIQVRAALAEGKGWTSCSDLPHLLRLCLICYHHDHCPRCCCCCRSCRPCRMTDRFSFLPCLFPPYSYHCPLTTTAAGCCYCYRRSPPRRRA